MIYFESIVYELLGRLPVIIAWVVAIAFATAMVNRGGGKAEKFLLAGGCLMLAVQIITPVLNGTVPLMSQRGLSLITFAYINSITAGIISLAGIVCLVYAFWVKFKAGQSVKNESPESG